MQLKKVFSGVLALVLLGAMAAPGALAETKYRRLYDPETKQYVYVPVNTVTKLKTDKALKNPMVKQALVGAGVGAAASLFTDRTSLLRGAGVGALVGAGTGLVDNSDTLADKPLLRSSLKGAAIGTGVSALGRHNTLKGAAVGAGVGAGAHYLKNYLNSNGNNTGW